MEKVFTPVQETKRKLIKIGENRNIISAETTCEYSIE
jgi:hypothetical protein